MVAELKLKYEQANETSDSTHKGSDSCYPIMQSPSTLPKITTTLHTSMSSFHHLEPILLIVFVCIVKLSSKGWSTCIMDASHLLYTDVKIANILSSQNLDADETDLENTYVYDNLNSVDRRCKQQGAVQSVEIGLA